MLEAQPTSHRLGLCSLKHINNNVAWSHGAAVCSPNRWLDTYGLDTYGLDTYGLDTYGLDTYGLVTYGLDTYGLDTYVLDTYGLDSDGRFHTEEQTAGSLCSRDFLKLFQKATTRQHNESIQ